VNVDVRPRPERIHWLRYREVHIAGRHPLLDRAWLLESVPADEVRREGVEMTRIRTGWQRFWAVYFEGVHV
jgi:hypothetical protein